MTNLATGKQFPDGGKMVSRRDFGRGLAAIFAAGVAPSLLGQTARGLMHRNLGGRIATGVGAWKNPYDTTNMISLWDGENHGDTQNVFKDSFGTNHLEITSKDSSNPFGERCFNCNGKHCCLGINSISLQRFTFEIALVQYLSSPCDIFRLGENSPSAQEGSSTIGGYNRFLYFKGYRRTSQFDLNTLLTLQFVKRSDNHSYIYINGVDFGSKIYWSNNESLTGDVILGVCYTGDASRNYFSGKIFSARLYGDEKTTSFLTSSSAIDARRFASII